jgi:hypothetical protein
MVHIAAVILDVLLAPVAVDVAGTDRLSPPPPHAQLNTQRSHQFPCEDSVAFERTAFGGKKPQDSIVMSGCVLEISLRLTAVQIPSCKSDLHPMNADRSAMLSQVGAEGEPPAERKVPGIKHSRAKRAGNKRETVTHQESTPRVDSLSSRLRRGSSPHRSTHRPHPWRRQPAPCRSQRTQSQRRQYTPPISLRYESLRPECGGAHLLLVADRCLRSTGSCSQSTEPCSQPSSRRTESHSR